MSRHLTPPRRYMRLAYVRPRSAAALLPADDEPGNPLVEHLLGLARRVLPLPD